MRKVCDKSESLTLCPTDGELILNRTVCGILIVVTRFIFEKQTTEKGFIIRQVVKMNLIIRLTNLS